jgi:hypothetical protein
MSHKNHISVTVGNVLNSHLISLYIHNYLSMYLRDCCCCYIMLYRVYIYIHTRSYKYMATEWLYQGIKQLYNGYTMKEVLWLYHRDNMVSLQ